MQLQLIIRTSTKERSELLQSQQNSATHTPSDAKIAIDTSGVVVLSLHCTATPSGAARTLDSFKARLVELNLHAIVILVEDGPGPQAKCNAREARELRTALDNLKSLAVPLICAVEGSVGDVGLALCLKADYRVAGRGAVICPSSLLRAELRCAFCHVSSDL